MFIPQKVADRLREYALQVCNASSDRIFPIPYEGVMPVSGFTPFRLASKDTQN